MKTCSCTRVLSRIKLRFVKAKKTRPKQNILVVNGRWYNFEYRYCTNIADVVSKRIDRSYKTQGWKGSGAKIIRISMNYGRLYRFGKSCITRLRVPCATWSKISILNCSRTTSNIYNDIHIVGHYLIVYYYYLCYYIIIVFRPRHSNRRKYLLGTLICITDRKFAIADTNTGRRLYCKS